jgi:hypothetical protein
MYSMTIRVVGRFGSMDSAPGLPIHEALTISAGAIGKSDLVHNALLSSSKHKSYVALIAISFSSSSWCLELVKDPQMRTLY